MTSLVYTTLKGTPTPQQTPREDVPPNIWLSPTENWGQAEKLVLEELLSSVGLEDFDSREPLVLRALNSVEGHRKMSKNSTLLSRTESFLTAFPSTVDSIGCSVADRRASDIGDFPLCGGVDRPASLAVAANLSISVDACSDEIASPDGSISPEVASPGPSKLSILGYANINGFRAPIVASPAPSINPVDGSTIVAQLLVPINAPPASQNPSIPRTVVAQGLSNALPQSVPAPAVGIAGRTPHFKLLNNNRSGPAFIMDAMFRIMQSNRQAQLDYTLGWLVLEAIWGLTPADFDPSVLHILLNRKTPREAEEVLLALATVDLSTVRHLSPFTKSLIKEHEISSQVCIRFLAGLCDSCADHHSQCPFVHPENTIGWELLRQRWGVTHRDLDFAAVSYLCKQKVELRDPILIAFAEQNLRGMKNLSATLNRIIRVFERSSSSLIK